MFKNYRLLNNVAGWVAFVIASVTYLSTIEPTASFWDCGEFITTSYKLEVGHPPGAPFFMILGRFFSLFASPSNVAMMINSLSALASAFTILFLFWTITHLARKMAGSETLTTGQTLAILGSGMVGALAYTFSDTFWFSAVEGEVYASSSLITAVVFWAILKWENVADEPHANRWIIFIAYMVGLSIGIHLLNLLAIPAIVFVYYFKKYTVSRNGVIISFLLSILISISCMDHPGGCSAEVELLFVNGLGIPFNTGDALRCSAGGADRFRDPIHDPEKAGVVEHGPGVPYGDPDWLFIFCNDCHPFVGQYPDGPKQPRQCFLPAGISEPGTIR